jgi:alpha-beta hydrolase superfamily lysophospholipase
VDQYVAEPMCGFGLDPDGVRGMVDAAPKLVDTSALRAGLPLYVLVGSDDPVNGGGAALDPLLDRYRAAGLHVTLRRYEGGRHEMFNETNRDEVVADLISWLDGNLPG